MPPKAKRKKDAALSAAVTIPASDLRDSARESSRVADESGADAGSAFGLRLYSVRPNDSGSSLQSVTERLCEETPATGAAIALDRDGQIVCVASTGTAPPVGVVIDRTTGISGVCLRTGKTTVCGDTETDTRVNRVSADYIRSIIAAPVLCDDEATGLVEIFSPLARAFAPSHIAFAEHVAQSLEQRRARSKPFVGSLERAAAEPELQSQFLATINGNRAFQWLRNPTFPESAQSGIARIVANSRTIAITALVLAIFLAVLWLAL